ncbi:MAG: cytochrome c biogenesis protein ResB [Chlorobiaceae bacterium]|nr:cytochrome c biogenesis protein ResB [Chlorobiaceae bacterium]
MQTSKSPLTPSSPPEGFGKAALFTLSAIIAGFAIEFLTSGNGITIPRWPANGLFLAAFASAIAAVGFGFRDHPVVGWMGGIPVGLSLIVGLALLSLVGGVLPQDPLPPGSMVSTLRLNGMFSSWPFAFVTLLFLFNLGLSLLWKTVPFRVANLQFILFHGGFWLALACGLAGTADLQRLIIPLYEGKESNVAYEMPSERPVHVPFSIYLNDFQIDEYVPQFALYDPATDQVIAEKAGMVPEVRKGARAVWPGIASATVTDFRSDALPDRDGNPLPSNGHKGVPFAKVRVEVPGQAPVERWINGDGPDIRPQFIPVGDYFIVIAPGAPKAFRSHVMIRSASGGHQPGVLEVNKPVDVLGWKLYQMGYDEKAGRWSTMSLVEAVNDPWLPAVYLGFFMIMAGNLLFFWKGVKKMEAA